MSYNQNKIDALVEDQGCGNEENFVLENIINSVVPGICNNPGCDYITDVEPDQDMGWCELCDTKTVKSGLHLMGYV